MKRIVKYIISNTYKPLLVKYLSGTRHYRYQNIHLEIPPEVFHPGFFFSTRLLLRYLSRLSLANKTLLELGAGSGLISIYAAQQGANVTASDISPVSVQAIRKNKFKNKADMTVVESDLFAAIPIQAFDFIVINPPYYKKKPLSWKDYAWYCGEDGEYFKGLFAGLSQYIHTSTEVLMILCDACDVEMIKEVASAHSFHMNCVQTSQNLVEKNFIFQIENTQSKVVR
jgi:release factor glutamine methyltransferase